jgi:hypothetical protein
MAIGVKIDFDKTIDFDEISEDLRTAKFPTEIMTGGTVELKIEISNEAHALLPQVFNLAFGPINKRGQIDDRAELPHKDYSRVFSTILIHALNYLTNHADQYVGVDGSDNYRAYYYWRFLQRNYDYLDKYFEMFGLKYYVRITRFGKNQYDNPFDFEDIDARPDRIYKTDEGPRLMYNYFIFKVK